MRSTFAALLLATTALPVAAQPADLAALQARLAALEKEAAAISEQLRSLQTASAAPAQATAVATDQMPQRILGDKKTVADRTNELQKLTLVEENGGAQSRIGAGLPDSPLSTSKGDAARFLLSAGSDDATVTLQLSRTHARTEEAGPLAGYTSNRLIEETLSLIASAKLASYNLDRGRKSGFSRLDSLSDGQKFTFRWSQMRSRIPDVSSGRFAEINALAVQNCKSNKDNLKAAEAAVAEAAKGEATAGRVTVDSVLESICDTVADSKFYAKYLVDKDGKPLNEVRERQFLFDRGLLRKSFSYGFEASLGYNEFSYFTAATPDPTNPLGFAKTNVSRVGWEVGGYASIFPLPQSALTLRGRYQDSFKAVDAVTVCPPFPVGATSVQCTTGAFAIPKQSEKVLLGAEYRFWGGSGKGLVGRWAVAPSITFDALSDDYEIDVPVFLVGNADGKLTGGIRFGYSNDDKAVFGVFIGSAFDLFR